MLNAVYEQDFLGFSYGFRPGRSPHDALDALAVAITRKKVNYVLDADVRDFFTRLDQGWLERFIEHRIADRRVLRLIQKWLRAGVIEDGEWSDTLEGTAQGASVSPLLANVFLHYVFDLWADQWRRRNAHGDVVLVRFADDYVAGFEHREDAERFLAELRERFAQFGLELHPEKTRLIEFGRFAAANRARRGERKPETFTFLGFTHVCARTNRTHQLRCRHCRARTALGWQELVAASAFGPGLQAAMVTLTARHRISRRGICELASRSVRRLGLDRAVDGICQRASDALAGPHLQLQDWVLDRERCMSMRPAGGPAVKDARCGPRRP